MDKVRNNSFLQFNTHSLIAHLKPASTITMLAVGVLGAMAATYYDPRKVILGVISLGAVQILTLPQLLENCDHVLGRLALLSSFAAFGSLVLGSTATLSYRTFNKLITNIFAQTSWDVKTEALLIGAWAFTALISYGMPLGYNFLKKVYNAINDSQFKNKLIHVADTIRYSHANVEIQNRNVNLRPIARFFEFIIYRFIIIEALIFPRRVLVRIMQEERTNLIASSILYAFRQIQFTGTLFNDIKEMASFKHTIGQLIYFVIVYENLPLQHILQFLPHIKSIVGPLIKDLKIIVQSLEGEPLDFAIDVLRDHVIQLIPNLISAEQFIELCQGKAEKELNRKADQFLANINTISQIEKECAPLIGELTNLEAEILQHKASPNKEIEKDLSDRLATITKQFTKQREKIESLYLEKQSWKLFISYPSLSPLVTRFEEILEQIRDRDPGEAKDKLQAIYQDMLKMSSNSEQEASSIAIVANTIQRLSNQLAPMEEDKNTEAYLFLATDCQFVVKDYDDLKDWLGVDQYEHIETKLEAIGLKNKQDLYNQEILKEAEFFNKRVIKTRLENFIKMKLKRNIRSHIYSVLSGFKPTRTSLTSLVEKIIKLKDRLVLVGFVLVPMFMYSKIHTVEIVIGVPLGIIIARILHRREV